MRSSRPLVKSRALNWLSITSTFLAVLIAASDAQAAVIQLVADPFGTNGAATSRLGITVTSGTATYDNSADTYNLPSNNFPTAGLALSPANVYTIELSDVNGVTGLDVQFDLTVTAGSTNIGANPGLVLDRVDRWIVDGDGVHATNPPAAVASRASRVNSGESLTFLVDNFSITSDPGFHVASFVGFNSLDYAIGDWWTLIQTTGVASHNGTDFTAIDLNFSIDVSHVVPEPSSAAFLGLGVIGLCTIRRRRRR